MHTASCALHPTPNIHSTPCTLHPTPFSFNPKLRVLNSAPSILSHAPWSLNLKASTLISYHYLQNWSRVSRGVCVFRWFSEQFRPLFCASTFSWFWFWLVKKNGEPMRGFVFRRKKKKMFFHREIKTPNRDWERKTPPVFSPLQFCKMWYAFCVSVCDLTRSLDHKASTLTSRPWAMSPWPSALHP